MVAVITCAGSYVPRSFRGAQHPAKGSLGVLHVGRVSARIFTLRNVGRLSFARAGAAPQFVQAAYGCRSKGTAPWGRMGVSPLRLWPGRLTAWWRRVFLSWTACVLGR